MYVVKIGTIFIETDLKVQRKAYQLNNYNGVQAIVTGKG
jgi:hypothetical protein